MWRPKAWLWPLSIPYQIVIQTRNRLYDLNLSTIHDVGVPVISIGNLTVGGTGKTPFVIHLIERIKQLSVQPKSGGKEIIGKKKLGVISRGYKGSAKGTTVVSDGRRMIFGPDIAGDEPVLIAESSPSTVVVSDKNRVRGAQVAIDEYQVKLILLDDAFQHRRIKRDLDIVLLDGKNPLGNRRLLPAGFLREPVSSLARADLIVLSKAIGSDEELVERARRLEELINKPVVVTRLVPTYWKRAGKAELLSADQVADKKVTVFAGIANPGSFFDTVGDLGANIKKTLPLPDHCSYNKLYIDKISNWYVRTQSDWLVTTAKDAVKLPAISHLLPIYYLETKLVVVVGSDHLDTALYNVLSAQTNTQSS